MWLTCVIYSAVLLSQSPAVPGLMMFAAPLGHSTLINLLAADRCQEDFVEVARSLVETSLAADFGGHFWRIGNPRAEMKWTAAAMKAAVYSDQLKNPGALEVDPCELHFSSPIEDMVETIFELAVRASVIAATETNTTQKVRYYGERTTMNWLGSTAFSRVCLVFALLIGFLQLVNLVYAWWGIWRLPKLQMMRPATITALVKKADTAIPLEEVQPQAEAEEGNDEEGEDENDEEDDEDEEDENEEEDKDENDEDDEEEKDENDEDDEDEDDDVEDDQ